MIVGCGLYSSGSQQPQVMGSNEHSNELLGSKKFGIFLD